MPFLVVTGGPTPAAGQTLVSATLEVVYERPYADGSTTYPTVHQAELDETTGGWKPKGAADGVPLLLPGAATGDPVPPPALLTERHTYEDGTTQRFARRVHAIVETTPGEWVYATPSGDEIVGSAEGSFPYGSRVVEQRTDADAIGGAVTFSEVIQAIEVANLDTVDGVFTVNGFPITVFAGAGYRSPIGGTPSATVAIAGASAYEIRRLE